MIEVVMNIMDLMIKFIEGLYMIEIDLSPGFYVSLGELFIGFLIVVLSIYFMLIALGVIPRGDDE